MNLSKREKTGLYVFAVIVLFLISYIYFTRNKKGEIMVNSSSEAITPSVSASYAPTEAQEAEAQEIRAYICGAVAKPGVYTLINGDRIDTLLSLAGGATDDADLSAINLAERMTDEQYVRVPSKEEGDASSSADGGGVEISQAKNKGLININTAGAEELDTLPGIGPAIAAKIVAYREENGKFSSIEQIKNVNGIGDSKYESLKDLICVK